MKHVLFALMVLLAACKAPQPESPAVTATPTEAAAPAADVVAEPAAEPASPQPLLPAASAWVGKWNGPEGTFLELTEDGAGYKLTIQSLDGPATYDAVAIEDRVEFRRDGNLETLRATSGAETGMKWLLDKNDCLTIKTGEGFCRD